MREAVAARFGQPLRYPSHCDALEAELQKAAATGGRRLSPSTLRRFFGLVDKEGGYHLHTLDTLARYAGHADFATFGQAIAGLVARGDAPSEAPTDIPELLAMERLAYPERLLLGYFLGRVTRPASPTDPAAPLALRLAAHPAGQEFFVECFVDMAYLNGAYGDIVREYLRHKPTPEAQLFGHCALFLGSFLAEDETTWRARLRQLLALPVPANVHPFPLGRRAFAEIVAAWYDAPDRQVPPARLQRLRRQAAGIPRSEANSTVLPAFYNLFPAGYYFFVAEALFLTTQYAALRDWLDITDAEFPELALLEENVFNELMRAFRAVAELRTEGATPSATPPTGQVLFGLDTHSWLLDYYQVHFWLAQLHFAAPGSHEAAQLRGQVQEFAAWHGMPFYTQVARRVSRC
ncbi:hypothetical protein GCM10023185_22370 [Hymenobacter saemangeumensis]|uniref:Uncharacterized protein n=1 Tax=Hymenobacter saemangeumensis TaxID=1084522 RepID=A0ABP8IF09_9BACT